jgi:PPOX class probable FMN-dependent enzyme
MAVKWKDALLKSLDKNGKLPYSKFFQLATVKPDGKPANRTVVYRDFVGDSTRITFTTDTRTRKVEDFTKQPWAEICWYFPETREQYRLGGNLTLIDENATAEADKEARQKTWEEMSKSLRAWFAGPTPGAPRTANEEELEKPPHDTSDPAVPSFGLVIMDVEEVDYVDLLNNQRQVYHSIAASDGQREWKEQALNP